MKASPPPAGLRRVLGGLFACALVSGCAWASSTRSEGPVAAAEASSPLVIEVSILSAGRGVPESARAAYARILEIVRAAESREDGAVRPRELRIGLEGERRLCIEVADRAQGEALLERVREVGEGVELLTISTDATGCRSTAPSDE